MWTNCKFGHHDPYTQLTLKVNNAWWGLLSKSYFSVGPYPIGDAYPSKKVIYLKYIYFIYFRSINIFTDILLETYWCKKL